MSFQDGSERMVGHSVFIAVAAVARTSETIMRRLAKSPIKTENLSDACVSILRRRSLQTIVSRLPHHSPDRMSSLAIVPPS
jgi:hypothetical protein